MRRKLIDLKTQRTALLEGAEALLKAGKREEYRAEMEKVSNMNADIKDLQDLIQEQDRKFLDAAPDRGEERDKALERAEVLKKGGEVKFSARETIRDVYQASKQITLATGTIVQPTGAGTAYQVGDKVTFKGVRYVCRLPQCVWSPADYPAGWQKQA